MVGLHAEFTQTTISVFPAKHIKPTKPLILSKFEYISCRERSVNYQN